MISRDLGYESHLETPFQIIEDAVACHKYPPFQEKGTQSLQLLNPQRKILSIPSSPCFSRILALTTPSLPPFWSRVPLSLIWIMAVASWLVVLPLLLPPYLYTIYLLLYTIYLLLYTLYLYTYYSRQRDPVKMSGLGLPLVTSLLRLPVSPHKSTPLTIAYRVLCSLIPFYVSDLISHYFFPCSLRSSHT